MFEKEIKTFIYENLKSQNRSFDMIKIEAPLFIPSELISTEYSVD
jgi:hypothetical protein